jgi:hypothetical protein
MTPKRAGLLSFLLLVAAPAVSWAQGGTPLGPEFRVNTYTSSAQNRPAIAADGGGSFSIVWNSNTQDGSGFGIYGQRYGISGPPLGPEFRVNTYTTGYQQNPSVAADNAGNFVVAWASGGEYGGPAPDIAGQRYASSGAPLGAEFRVNTYTTGAQSAVDVASGPAGNFVVVWTSDGQDGSSTGIFGQIYNPIGIPLGPEFRVNTSTTGQQYGASVAAGTGTFVVTWSSGGGYGGPAPDVLGQRFLGDGTPMGSEFRVNTYTTDVQIRSSVASDPAGNFIVVWDSAGQDGSSAGVFGQRFASSGAPLGPEFRVNTYTTDLQYGASVSRDANGAFVVAWSNTGGYGGVPADVFGQRFGANGAPLGPEFRVNTYTSNAQDRVAVAADPLGNFMVTWDSVNQDGSLTGVYGQRYAPIVPVELMHAGVE